MSVVNNNVVKFSGFYRGQVKQHLKAGKCKIYIPDVYSEEYEENPSLLPSAEQAAPLFGGVCDGNGMFSYPNIGAIVWCFFENGDHNRPVYFASTLGGELATTTPGQGFMKVRTNVCNEDKDNKNTTLTGTDALQHCIVCQSENGSSEIMFRQSGQIEIKTESSSGSSKILINGNGSIVVDTTDTIQVKSPSIKITGDQQIELNTTALKVRASDELFIEAPQVFCKSGNSVTVSSPSIKMDASDGMFMATSKNHSPLIV